MRNRRAASDLLPAAGGKSGLDSVEAHRSSVPNPLPFGTSAAAIRRNPFYPHELCAPNLKPVPVPVTRYERYTVPYQVLRIRVVSRGHQYRIEIEGFPRAAIPVLFETPSKAEARRLAREASSYMAIPIDG